MSAIPALGKAFSAVVDRQPAAPFPWRSVLLLTLALPFTMLLLVAAAASAPFKRLFNDPTVGLVNPAQGTLPNAAYSTAGAQSQSTPVLNFTAASPGPESTLTVTDDMTGKAGNRRQL